MDWNHFCVSSLGHLNQNSNPSSVINLFKLSKDYTPPDEQLKSPKFDYLEDLKYDDLFGHRLGSSSYIDYLKDIQTWDRDKSTVIEIVTRRLKNLDDSIKHKVKKSKLIFTNNEKTISSSIIDDVEIVMSSECEILISWLDKYFYDNERLTEESQKVFIENAAKLLTNYGLNHMNFLNFLIDIGKLSNNKTSNFLLRYLKVSLNHLHKHAWGSLHISILNTQGIFMNSLVFKENRTVYDILKTFIECANIVYPGQNTYMDNGLIFRSSEYYFYLAYMLFRSGSSEGLDLLIKDKDNNFKKFKLDYTQFPTLYTELLEILRDILLDKQNENKHILFEKFSREYYQSENNITLGSYTKDSNYYALLLLSIVYPDYYSQVPSNSLATKEDYLWYQIHLMLANTGCSLVLSAYNLCHSLTQEVNHIKSNDNNLVDRILSYAYSIALAGGVIESLRMLMSAVKVSSVQTFAVFFVVYYENCGLLEFEELRYISHKLWNMNNKFMCPREELSYLVQLAFNRRRKVSPELKILLSTMMSPSKNIMSVKYSVSENFNDAVNPCYLGSSLTRNGMLLVGPLLQKLIKLSVKRNSAKYAILLLAQYSAHVGLWASAFKCFYCIQDVENCASVLEACCCYLYDNSESDLNKSFTIEDLSVYYTLLKNIAPNNKHVLELKSVFNCILLCVLVKNNEYLEAVNHCKKNKMFENTIHIFRNESHQIYFNALYSYINALKFLVSNGKQPSELLSSLEANNLLDLLEAAYQNTNNDKQLTVEALHLLFTFISIVPPK